MELTFVSSRTHEVNKANHLGWELEFTITKDQDNTVVNVTVQGHNTGNPSERLNVNVSSQNQNATVNFSGGKYYNELADAVIAEVDVIFGEGE